MSSLRRSARRKVIAVVGAGECNDDVAAAAEEIGRLVARRGGVLVTGGRSGVMEAASRGAHHAGGTVVGILPGPDPREANRYVEIAIPTGMGQMRNGLVVAAAGAVIAVAGEWGTLSEIGLALKTGRPVIGLDTWEFAKDGTPRDGIVRVDTPEDAVEAAFAQYSNGL